MLALILALILVQLAVAAMAPRSFVYLSLWLQALPYTWTLDTQAIIPTPIGPLNVIAIQLFGFIVACGLVLIPRLDAALTVAARNKWHVAFLLFCVFSLIYAPSLSYGTRMIAKLIGPFLFMIVCAVTILTPADLQRAGWSMYGSGLLLLALAVLARLLGLQEVSGAGAPGPVGLGPPGMGPAVFSAHMLSVSMLALGAYVTRPRVDALLMTLVFAASVLLTFERTSAAALMIGASLVFFVGTRGPRRLVLPLLAIVAVPLLFVFNSGFRARMFYNNASVATIGADPASALQLVNSSGRFELWSLLMNRFFYPHPIVGSGIGATQEFLYEQSPSGLGVTHSDYVRLLCEVGVLGVCLFAIALLFYLSRLLRFAREARNASERAWGLSAVGCLVTYILFMATDNGLDYVTQFGVFVFALIGFAMRQGAHRVEANTQRAELRGRAPFPNVLRW